MKIGTYLEDIEQQAVTCSPGDSAQDAATRMRENGIGAMPVLCGDGKLVGMISERDLVWEFSERGAEIQNLKVEDLLTKSVSFMSPEAVFADAMVTMNKHGFRHIPIVREGNVLGVISIRDVLAYAIQNEGEMKLHPILAVASR